MASGLKDGAGYEFSLDASGKFTVTKGSNAGATYTPSMSGSTWSTIAQRLIDYSAAQATLIRKTFPAVEQILLQRPANTAPSASPTTPSTFQPSGGSDTDQSNQGLLATTKAALTLPGAPGWALPVVLVGGVVLLGGIWWATSKPAKANPRGRPYKKMSYSELKKLAARGPWHKGSPSSRAAEELERREFAYQETWDSE